MGKGAAADEGSPARRPPLSWLRLAAVAAACYALAALTWVALGDTLPGGRWFAVHLFTLGILSNLVIALSDHFTETLLHVSTRGNRQRRLVAWNASALLLLGFPPSLRYPFAIAAAGLVGVVAWLLVDLRHARRRGAQQRFGFVVRAYEHAAIAFLAGAALGALLGLGILSGRWYGAGRLAHLHVNVLGWGGLTVLATIVFFGPTMVRGRIVEGAERRAARALAVASAGLAAAVAGLLATGHATWADAGRVLGAVGLVLYAVAAAVVGSDLLRTARSARPSAERTFIVAACGWFLVAVLVAAFAVGSARWRLLDAAGAVLIVGVLGQAIIAAMGYLSPMMWGTGAAPRAAIRGRVQQLRHLRALALNAGVLLVAGAVVLAPVAEAGGALAVVGWAFIAVAVVATIAVLAAGARAGRSSASSPHR